MSNPPAARYRYTLEVTGNTLDEIAHELTVQANGGFMLDSDYQEGFLALDDTEEGGDQ